MAALLIGQSFLPPEVVRPFTGDLSGHRRSRPGCHPPRRGCPSIPGCGPGWGERPVARLAEGRGSRRRTGLSRADAGRTGRRQRRRRDRHSPGLPRRGAGRAGFVPPVAGCAGRVARGHYRRRHSEARLGARGSTGNGLGEPAARPGCAPDAGGGRGYGPAPSGVEAGRARPGTRSGRGPGLRGRSDGGPGGRILARLAGGDWRPGGVRRRAETRSCRRPRPRRRGGVARWRRAQSSSGAALGRAGGRSGNRGSRLGPRGAGGHLAGARRRSRRRSPPARLRARRTLWPLSVSWPRSSGWLASPTARPSHGPTWPSPPRL